jgi:subtilisin family serine protease
MIHFLLISLIISAAFGYVEVDNRELEHIPGEYLITYHLNTTEDDARSHVLSMANLGAEFIGIWNTGFHRGFAAKLSDEVVEQLQHDPMVMAIEVNIIIRLAEVEQTCGGNTANALSWGLSRISFSGSIGSGLPPRFIYPANGGTGVTVYVADTGILTTHQDFGGRASFGVNYSTDSSTADGNGHGTHCAGTIGGTTYGVAKGTTLVAVKVLSSGGSGSIAGIVNGVNWVAARATSGKSVISMSLGGSGTQTALQTAINSAVNGGVAVVVAAGNDNSNACNYSPAGFASCITVGATALNSANTADSRSSFSNFGTCVDIFAPGTNIRSAWIGSNTATNTISGTSMACPHVAGLSATILQVNSNMSPAQLRSTLNSNSQTGLIGNVGTGSPNRLAYNGC